MHSLTPDMDEANHAPFLHDLSTIRNLGAHHSRLWNREFTFTFRLPGHRPQALVASLNPRDGRRLYNILTDLAWLPGCISSQHHWKQRLKTLLLQHTIDPQPMGFPAGWEQLAIWKEGTE